MLLEVTNSNVSITYKKISRQQIYEHIQDMKDLAEELPEKTIEIYMDDSDKENPKFSFEESDEEE